MRGADVDAPVSDLEPQRIGEVLDARFGSVMGAKPGDAIGCERETINTYPRRSMIEGRVARTV